MQPIALILNSNDTEDNLKHLEDERKYIEDALMSHHVDGKLITIARSYTTVDDFYELVKEFSGNILLIHIAGHFSKGFHFNNNKYGTQITNNEGIAGLLKNEIENGILEFVFLNGCSTKSLLTLLKKNRTPSIIGTNYAVNDFTATNFAKDFYERLASSANLKTAFEYAKSKLVSLNRVSNHSSSERGFVFDVTNVGVSEPWELYTTNPIWILPKRKFISENRGNGDIAKISCDRKKILARFAHNFEVKEEAGICCHFYFLAHQPYGEVESLLNRLENKLVEERANTKTSFESINPFEIYVDPSFKYEGISRAFKKAFNQVFKTYIESKKQQYGSVRELVLDIPEEPNLKEFSYFPLYLKINMTGRCWEVSVYKALDWFINNFAKLNKSDYTFIFFIVIKVRPDEKKSFWSGLFKRKKSVDEIYNVLTELESINGFKNITVLPPLGKVTREDLDDWYRIYERNAVVRKTKVDELVEKLRMESKHDEPWDMSHVEKELEKIVDKVVNVRHEI